MKRLLPIGLVVLPALSLLAVVALIVMLLSVNADVADLTRRLRGEAHTANDLHGQIATLREELSTLQAAAPAAPDAPAKAAQPAPPAEQPHAESTVVARPIKVTSSSGSPECFFKAGDSSGLVTCIRSEQARIAEFRAPGRYR